MLLGEELRMALQVIFKTADELGPIDDLENLEQEFFQEMRKRLVNFKANYQMRYLNLLQDMNERQLDLNVFFLFSRGLALLISSEH